jgi:hypothetical protein
MKGDIRDMLESQRLALTCATAGDFGAAVTHLCAFAGAAVAAISKLNERVNRIEKQSRGGR